MFVHLEYLAARADMQSVDPEQSAHLQSHRNKLRLDKLQTNIGKIQPVGQKLQLWMNLAIAI